MARFTGAQYKGAQRDAKEERRKEAVERNAATLPENRRQARLKAQSGA